MPTLFKMSDEKQTVDSPAVVVAETSSASSRKTKKYVIIAVSTILAAVIILAAILVGMYMFTEAQKEIIQYSLSLNDKAKQDVTSDPNENVVQYHVTTSEQETWIVNDFNKDIQVVKIQTDEETNCYVSALNRSAAMDPSKVVKPESSDIKGTSALTYITSGTPIVDTSFLGKTASTMCKGVSVYWVYPQCTDGKDANTNDTGIQSKSKRDSVSLLGRSKRQQSVDGSPYYYICYPNSNTVCVKGCCKSVCACKVTYNYYVDNSGVIHCSWYTYDCNGNPVSPTYNTCYNGPTGLSCPSCSYNYYPC